MQTTRDESFIPLSPAALPSNERPDFRVTVLSQAGTTQPFLSVGQSGPIEAASHAFGHEARVSLVREGDRISAIQVHCACGRIVELACVYETATAQTAPAPPSLCAAAPKPGPAATSESVMSAATPSVPPAPAAAAAPVEVSKPGSAQGKSRGK